MPEQELLLQAAERRGRDGWRESVGQRTDISQPVRLTLFCLVDQHVSLQLVGVREIAGTKLALVRSLSSVDPDVSPEVGHLDKLPVTVRTTIRLLSWKISVS